MFRSSKYNQGQDDSQIRICLTWSELIVKDYDKLAVLCEYIQDLIALDYEILIDVSKLRNAKLLCVTMLLF
jgi:hypothetical protein